MYGKTEVQMGDCADCYYRGFFLCGSFKYRDKKVHVHEDRSSQEGSPDV